MARIARVVLPGYPHHVTRRGNRRQVVCFNDEDYRTYRALMAKACRTAATQVWACCLMPNHVHLILVPSRVDGLHARTGRPLGGENFIAAAERIAGRTLQAGTPGRRRRRALE